MMKLIMMLMQPRKPGVGCDDWNFGVYLQPAVSQKTETIDKSIRAVFKFFCCSKQIILIVFLCTGYHNDLNSH